MRIAALNKTEFRAKDRKFPPRPSSKEIVEGRGSGRRAAETWPQLDQTLTESLAQLPSPLNFLTGKLSSILEK